MSTETPSPTDLSAADANRILYAKIADTYDQSEECVVDERLRQRLRAVLLKALASVKEVTELPRVLDACGGSGNASLMLMSLGMQPVTVDISSEMLAIFREKAQAQGYAPECVISELGDFLAGDSREWNMIVFSSALHHFEDPETMLDLARARMAPGGVIVTMFDPIRVGPMGRNLRRADYLLHVALRTPGRLVGLMRSRLRGPDDSEQANDRVVGEMAERHALLGLDDIAIQRAFVAQGWRIVEHDRTYEGRFGITRRVFQALGQPSSFSFIVQSPLVGADQDPSFSHRRNSA